MRWSKCSAIPYTRYPVYDGDVDDIVGILHVRTLFGASQNGAAASSDLRELIRPAHTVPETKRLADLLGEFRRTKSHMAIVVDEYGSIAGIATLEDLIEEIVGDIADEFDLPETAILRLGRDRLRIEGSFPIEDFNERFARELPTDDYTSIGGFVFGELGRAPQPGDVVVFNHTRFEVVAVDGTRILQVDVTLGAPPPRPSDNDEDDDVTQREARVSLHHEPAAERAADVGLDLERARLGGRCRAEEGCPEDGASTALQALTERRVHGLPVVAEAYAHARRALRKACDLAARGRARPGHHRAARVDLDGAYDDERRAAGNRDRPRVDMSQAPRLERLRHRCQWVPTRARKSAMIAWHEPASARSRVQVTRAAKAERSGT